MEALSSLISAFLARIRRLKGPVERWSKIGGRRRKKEWAAYFARGFVTPETFRACCCRRRLMFRRDHGDGDGNRRRRSLDYGRKIGVTRDLNIARAIATGG